MKATEFDVGPLSWVKSEIDLALKRADQALQEFSGGLPGGGDPTQLKFCRTHLHQVQGALTIVGLDGVTQLAEAAEALLERIEQGEQAPDEATLTLARRALSQEMSTRDNFTSPGKVRDWLRLRLANRPKEIFMALWLDAQNRLLKADELFAGTLTQTSVYPREVVKAALAHNAAAVILAHNHPSGMAEPSRADEMLTHSLKDALAMVDVKLLDHFIVAGNAPPLSFAERGLL